MTGPDSMDAYTQRFLENSRASGLGLEVRQHFPCPFCAAPDWFVVKLMEFAPPQQPGTYRTPPMTCAECGRGAQLVSVRGGDGGIVTEVVQTSGDDPPGWLDPPPRREDVSR